MSDLVGNSEDQFSCDVAQMKAMPQSAILIPYFSGGYIHTNNANPDHNAPRVAVFSGSTMFAVFIAPCGHINFYHAILFTFEDTLDKIFYVSERHFVLI